jgi:hypothetical protein
MSNFKGTKERWLISDCGRKIEISNSKRKTYQSILSMSGKVKWQYDIKLIACAPEMLEMLCNVKDYLGSDVREQVEQLIKKAT